MDTQTPVQQSPGPRQVPPPGKHAPASGARSGSTHTGVLSTEAWQFPEQQSLGCAQSDPTSRQLPGGRGVPKHMLFWQRPSQQLRSCVQYAWAMTQAGGIFGLSWQYEPPLSSMQ
jgi:hypothetical protein